MRTIFYLFLLFPLAVIGQQSDVLDVTKISTIIDVFPTKERVVGTQKVFFNVLKAADSVYLDGIKMRLLENKIKDIDVVASETKIWFIGPFEIGKQYLAEYTYEAFPKQTFYFTGDQFWTQGQGKYTSHWLPSLDDMKDKIEFDMTYTVPAKNSVIANGKLSEAHLSEDRMTYSFEMQEPMASYLVAIASGDFYRKELTSASGVPLEFYIRSEDSLKMEPTYRYTKEIFDFLETEIGVAYPWQNYKQVPVRDFLYAGMENTTATIFSEAFVVDSIGFNDRNYVNVNAHELAHQWFGNLVTETEGTHHWLHEGFATYYALLAEREVFGDDYYYWKLLQSAEQLEGLSQSGKGESLLNPKASSLTFYEKGAWALHILKERIGEEAFKTAIRNYLNKHAYKNVTTDDFLAEVRRATSIDIAQWEADWLRQSAFKAQQALESLTKSTFINDYFKASALRATPFAEKKLELEALLRQGNEYLGQEAVYQLAGEPIKETLPLYQLAMQSDNLIIRQAIATSVQNIPLALKPIFETLLEDGSYVTLEFALAGLASTYPEDRLKYLEPYKYVDGFQNKNIKLLWLAIAISSEVYGASANEIFLSELRDYSSPDYSFEVRQKALEYVYQLRLFERASLKHLVNACTHHNWRFRNTAREMLKNLLAEEKYVDQLKPLMNSFSEKEKNYLNRILENE
ncbi:MAG: M1 family aminopeptidase [Bacteroidota bacterium]